MEPVTERTRRRMTATERRETILEAAEDVFATSGYHGSSLDEIAQAAGISKALIYEHFASKRELHESLLSAHADEILLRLAANAAGGLDGEERLRGGVDAFLGFVEERRDAWRALFRDAADPDVVAVIDRVQAQATTAIAELIFADPSAPQRAPGETPEEHARNVEILAQLISGAVQALANWWYDHQDVPRAVLVDRVMEFAWLGLERVRDGEARP